MGAFVIASVFSLVCLLPMCINAQKSFNVMDDGAAGNGNTDDSLSFSKAWNATCRESGTSIMVIPQQKTFLLQPMTFSGPCVASNITVTLSGTIVAPSIPKEWKVGVDVSRWLAFKDISWLTVGGKGTINGRGKGWWDISCRYHPGQGCLATTPTVVRFENCSNMLMSNIYIVNSPQTHILVLGCQNAEFSFLNLHSPESSPNTDGIDISASNDVRIHDSDIGSGDDCVSIGDSTTKLRIHDVKCGPGHGISIGSLGGGGSEVHVEDIIVTRANFSGTTNGVRIKTYQEGKGNIRDIQFSDLIFDNAEHPIIIDQHYGNLAPPKERTGVHISNVIYQGARGTTKTPEAINLNCSNYVPCTNITLDTIQLHSTIKGQQLCSSCNYAHGVAKGSVSPKSCLVA